MLQSFKNLFGIGLMALALPGLSVPSSSNAQTYPIDCAILLCLSGGWPASAPCSRARAEFIRRITPWPVEPPLQIWRCPMGASYELNGRSSDIEQFRDVVFEALDDKPRQSVPVIIDAITAAPRNQVSRSDIMIDNHFSADFAVERVQDRADIDISGPEFNFVRSIRVFNIRYARQQESGREGDCRRSAAVEIGTYGQQGDFAWEKSSPSALPAAHLGLERWGDYCPRIYHRSVFVEWRDYNGHYGFEQVDY